MDRKKETEKLREKHQPTFEELGYPDAIFIPKMAYTLSGHGLVIGFFENEIREGNDVYVEFVSKQLVPEDEKRTLYKFKGNLNYMEDYSTTTPDSKSGSVRFLVPVANLEKIKEYAEDDFDIPDPAEDCPLESATIRDLAAIFWRKPVSRKKWINELVKKNK